MTNRNHGEEGWKIRVRLPAHSVDELERKAATMHLTVAEYALCILADSTFCDTIAMRERNSRAVSRPDRRVDPECCREG